MFLKRKNKNNINGYVKFISEIIKDETIKEEVIEQLKRFYEDGIINIDGNNLMGKIYGEDNLYLDIKIHENKFICSYTMFDMNSVVLIEQDNLKDGNYKITKSDKTKYYTNNCEDIYSTKIEERIISKTNELLYESKYEAQEEFASCKGRLVYKDDSPFRNFSKVEKRWYIPNGSIIVYQMDKNELYDKRKLEENYSICKEPCKTESCTIENYTRIPRELFIDFMSGKLSIEEVLDSLNKKEAFVKK